jgi:hypothetical protein
MVSWRAKRYVVCGDFPSGKIMVYPSHTDTDVVGCFRTPSYSKALMSTMSSCNLSGPHSPTAKGELWLASTLHIFVSNSFDSILFQITFA